MSDSNAQPPSSGETDDRPIATMSQVKRVVRRKLKRHGPHSAHGLNIYPMMDMMTILLVFMVMQFAASSAASIQQSEELTIPYSTSEVQLEEAVAVQISRSAILVDGEPIVELRNGLVDPDQKRGGANGFLITRLSRKMNRVRDQKKQIAEINPQAPFTGSVSIIADRRTPYRTLSEVIYTLGQSEFSELRFIVSREGG